MGSQWTKKMKKTEFDTIKAEAIDELKLTPEEWLRLLGTSLDSTGEPQDLMDTSGQVTEASAATISTLTGSLRYDTTAPFFGDPAAIQASDAQRYRSHRVVMAVPITATAGGEIVSADLVPALAGYRSAMMLQRVWSDQTDGSIALTIATTTGLTSGPGALTIATTANLINPDYGDGVAYYGSTDNEAITVLAAAGQTQANQVFEFQGVYWYET